jgi:hypothetical protein
MLTFTTALQASLLIPLALVVVLGSVSLWGLYVALAWAVKQRRQAEDRAWFREKIWALSRKYAGDDDDLSYLDVIDHHD